MRINIPKSTLLLLMFSLQEVARYVPVKEATGPKRLAIYCKTLMVSLEPADPWASGRMVGLGFSTDSTLPGVKKTSLLAT